MENIIKPIGIHIIVITLIKHSVLVNQWSKFHNALLKCSETLYFRPTEAYDKFNETLNKWQSSTDGCNRNISYLVKILKKEEFVSAAESLEELILKDEKSISKPFKFNNQNPSRDFCGQHDHLGQIRKLFLDNFKQFGYSIVICGPPGIGKTQLARKFIHEITKEQECNISWFSGEELHDSLLEFSKHVKLYTDEFEKLSTIEILQRVRVSISDTLPWIVVIDNVEEEIEILKEFVADIKNHTTAFVILTTRNKMVMTDESIDLNELDDADALNFVAKRLGISMDESKSLCKQLQNHPLALEHATTYIKQMKRSQLQYDVDAFEKDLSKRKVVLSECNLWPINLAALYEMTLKKFEDKIIDILYVLSHLNPNNIDVTLLKDLTLYSYPETTIKQIDDSLEELMNYSMVNLDDEQILIHRITQEVGRHHKSRASKDLILPQSLLKFFLQKSFGLNQYSSHMLSIWQNMSEETTTQLNYAIKIVKKLITESAIAEARNFAELVLKTFSEKAIQTSPEYLKMQQLLAQAMIHQTKYSDASDLLEMVLSNQKTILGESHADTLATAHDKARALHFLEDNDNAIQITRWVLEKREKTLEKDANEIFESKILLATILCKSKKYEEAKKLYEGVLTTRKIIYKNDKHYLVLNANHLFAWCLLEESLHNLKNQSSDKEHWMQQLRTAENQFSIVVKAREETLHSDHKETLRSRHWWGVAKYELGETKEGMSILENVLQRRKCILEVDHEDTKTTQKALDNVCEQFYDIQFVNEIDCNDD